MRPVDGSGVGAGCCGGYLLLGVESDWGFGCRRQLAIRQIRLLHRFGIARRGHYAFVMADSVLLSCSSVWAWVYAGWAIASRSVGGRTGGVVGLILILATALALSTPFALAIEPSGSSAATGPSSAAPAKSQAVPAARFAKNVAIITLDTGGDAIDWVTAYSIKRRIKLAEEAGADAMVFQISTPGGNLLAVLEICQAIKESSIKNSVAWINSRAFSGGAVIALACREIVLTDIATFGDAGIITVGAAGLETLGQTERAKVLAPLLTEVVDSARRAGYDEKLVQGFVTIGVKLWLVENTVTGQRMCIDAKEYEFLFGAAPDLRSPTLASVPQSVMDMPVRQAKDQPERPVLQRMFSPNRGGRKPTNPAAPRQTPAVPAAADANQQAEGAGSPLLPASSQITPEMAAQVSDELVSFSNRPVITQADVGQWKVLEFISDGNTIYTLKTDEMMRFGLGAARINNEQELKGHFGAVNLSVLSPAWSEAVVKFLTSTIVQIILIVVFLLALFLEMTHPGVLLPGTVATLALVALLGPNVLIGASGWWEIVAIVLGVVLIGLELFVLPGFGLFGVVGVVLLFGGLLGALIPGGAGAMFPGSGQGGSVGYAAAVLAVATALAGVGISFLARHLGSLPIIGKLVLADSPSYGGTTGITDDAARDDGLTIGMSGRAITPLRPSGKADIAGRIVDVVSRGGFVDTGVPVRLVAMDGFVVTVEALIGELPPELRDAGRAGDAKHLGSSQGGVG